jgi:hypothetical protein
MFAKALSVFMSHGAGAILAQNSHTSVTNVALSARVKAEVFGSGQYAQNKFWSSARVSKQS